MRWWQDVYGGAENDGWAVSVGEDGKIAVYGDVTVDRSGNWMLDRGWNFIWDDYGVPVQEDAGVGEVMSLIGLADGIWSEVVLSDEEKSWWKGDDGVNVCDFGGAVRELGKKFWRFWLKCVALADSDWVEDDWEGVWIERRFDLGTEDAGGDLINDDCDKYDDDDDYDDCGDSMACSVSIVNIENLMFPFSVRWRWSL